MPLIIYIFSICTFAIGFTEFVTIGLVSTISYDLGISVTQAGMAVTIYALGVVIGAPVLTAFSINLPRRSVLLVSILVFTLGNLMIGFTHHLNLFLIARLCSGFAHGVFIAVAASMVTRLVPANKMGRALALVFGGLTIAMSFGAPLGSWLGTFLSWQIIFIIIAVCSAIGCLGIVMFMPTDSHDTSYVSRWDALKILFNIKVLAGASVTILAFAGCFSLYAYISPFLLQVTQIDIQLVSIIMLCFGIGAAIGNILSGYLADRLGLDRSTIILLISITIALVGISFTANYFLGMIFFTGLLGMATYGSTVTLQGRMLKLAGKYASAAPDVVSGINIASFNMGIVLGSLFGMVTINTFGIVYTTWIGISVSLLAIIVLFLQIRTSETRKD